MKLPRSAAVVASFAATACLYAATWSGRYFHDGAQFANWLETGKRVYWHLAYLPTAAGTHRLLALLGYADEETALAILSVLSGAGCAALSFALVRRITGDVGRGFLATALLSLAPAPWFASTIVEVHIFAALAGCFAAWLAYLCPGGVFVALPLAAVIAVGSHVTSGFILAGLWLLAVAGEERGGRRPRFVRSLLAGVWTLLFAGATLTVASYLSGVGFGLSYRFEVWARLAAQATDLSLLVHRFIQECLRCWGAVVVAALLVPLAGDDRSRLPMLAVLAGVLPMVLFSLLVPPLEGLYLLPAFPFLALGSAMVLPPRVPRPVAAAVAIVVLAGHVGWSIHYRGLLVRDQNRVWAYAVNDLVEKPAFLICYGSERCRRARRVTGEPVFDVLNVLAVDANGRLRLAAGLSAAGLAERIWSDCTRLRGRGTHLYLDPQVLRPGPHVGELVELARLLRTRMDLTGAIDEPIVEVRCGTD